MSIKTGVCSLELSKELKELGVPQKSLWYWEHPYPDRGDVNNVTILRTDSCGISAFTSSELGEMLHKNFNEVAQGYNDSGDFWHFRFGGRGAGNMINGIGIQHSVLDLGEIDTPDSTEANARAKALIWLIENGHVDAKDLL